MKKIILSLSIFAVAALCIYIPTKYNISIEEKNTHVQVPAPTEISAVHPKVAQHEILEANTTEMVHAENTYTKHAVADVQVAKSKRVKFNDKITLLVPDITEEVLQRRAYDHLAKDLFTSLSPEMLDFFLKNYQDKPELMLTDMGLPYNCDDLGRCDYQVEDGSLLTVGKVFGLQLNDKIISLNNVPLKDIESYEQLKIVLFSSEGYMDILVDRNGETMTLSIDSENPPQGMI